MKLNTTMPKPFILAALLAGTLLLLAQPPRPAAAEMDAVEQEVLELVNQERTQRGLHALVATQTLDAAAAWMAWDMSTYDDISHTDTLGRDLWASCSSHERCLQA